MVIFKDIKRQNLYRNTQHKNPGTFRLRAIGDRDKIGPLKAKSIVPFYILATI